MRLATLAAALLCVSCGESPYPPMGAYRILSLSGTISDAETCGIPNETFSPSLSHSWNFMRIGSRGDLSYRLAFAGEGDQTYLHAGTGTAQNTVVTGKNVGEEGQGYVATIDGKYEGARFTISWTLEKHGGNSVCWQDMSGSGTFIAGP